jgi:ABC-2 type transport system ATP-binding protein
MSKTTIIHTHALTKTYGAGRTPALDRLDLTVEKGEIFGYLGPNGAGKSTTIRILMGLIAASGGQVRLFDGQAPSDIAARNRIGYLPGDMALWQGYTGAQVVSYFSKVRGVDTRAEVARLRDRLDLDLSKRVREYSTGNKRKLGLVLALMHQPELLILDEPTSGLDPLMQQTFNALMREQRNAGRTVFLSSHVLSEVQAICDRVAILRAGQLQAVERVDALMQTDFRWVTLTFDRPARPEWVQGVASVHDASADGNALRVRLSGDFDPLLRAVASQYVVNVHIAEPTLEEMFLAYYDRRATVAAPVR